jgi:hypothetical protein
MVDIMTDYLPSKFPANDSVAESNEAFENIPNFCPLQVMSLSHASI